MVFTLAPVLAAAIIVAQQAPALTGNVTDATGLPLPGALVTVAGSERVAVTDEHGRFTLASVANGAVLTVSLPGFVSKELRVPSDRADTVSVVLAVAGLREAVAVRAATPDVATQGVVPVTPLDVVRTPGAQADLMRALAAQPGVAQIDDGAGLFVRGGDVSEVLVLLDGVVVAHPYRYESPTGGFRGAVDPFMLQGASFTTGAFSAEYGNSLSAVVDMQTMGRPTDAQTNVTAGLAGVSASIAQPLGAHGGLRLAANRTTPSVLFTVNPSPKTFDQLPGGWDLSGSLTADSTRFGSVRITGLSQRDHVGVELEKDAYIGFLHSGTSHDLGIVRWQIALGPRWLVTVSAGNDRYTKSTDVGVIALDEREQHRSGRGQLTGTVGLWQLTAGMDGDAVTTNIVGQIPRRGGDLGGVSGADTFSVQHRDSRLGLFGVASRTVGRITAEAGARIDRFDAAGATAADPRGAVRIGLGHGHSVRIAAGRYRQAPSPLYFDAVSGAATLPVMSATHLVVGYEIGKPGSDAFARIEIYRKRYSHLPLDDQSAGFSGAGYGRASGADAFAKKTWSRASVQVSASLLSAERRYTSADQQDRYPLPAHTWRPDFDIPYSAQIIVDVPLPYGLSASSSWRSSAGRPFTPAVGATNTPDGFVPIWGEINSQRLPRYQRADLSLNWVVPFGQKSTAVFFASLDNAFNRRNVFEMAYSANYATPRPIASSAPRSFYVGCSITR